jgi:hypothetical protein
MMYYYANIYVGDFDNLSQQALIIDTGSGIMSFPCEGYCVHCGKHINSYYPVKTSKTSRILDCHVDNDCTCFNGTLCKFGQAYGEGSSYHGFWVEDNFYFGTPVQKDDKFKYQFGCVTNETNLFYTQEADGILGLSSTGRIWVKPIFDVLKLAGVTDKREFALCLGTNGGKFTIGGYDESLQANSDERMEWFPLNQPMSHYKIQLNKMMVGNVEIPNPPSRGFVDSGTTFAYMSSS